MLVMRRRVRTAESSGERADRLEDDGDVGGVIAPAGRDVHRVDMRGEQQRVSRLVAVIIAIIAIINQNPNPRGERVQAIVRHRLLARLAHARALFDLDPGTAVDAFVADDDLDPARLATEVFERLFVAGLDESTDPRGAVAVGAARYLTHAVARGRGEVNIVDRRVHDLALRAFCRVYPADPSALIGYVRDGAGTDWKTGEPLYDCAVATDLCERVGAVEVAICVHCDRGDHDAALALAMATSDDLALAKSVLDRAGRRSRSRFGVPKPDQPADARLGRAPAASGRAGRRRLPLRRLLRDGFRFRARDNRRAR